MRSHKSYRQYSPHAAPAGGFSCSADNMHKMPPWHNWFSFDVNLRYAGWVAVHVHLMLGVKDVQNTAHTHNVGLHFVRRRNQAQQRDRRRVRVVDTHAHTHTHISPSCDSNVTGCAAVGELEVAIHSPAQSSRVHRVASHALLTIHKHTHTKVLSRSSRAKARPAHSVYVTIPVRSAHGEPTHARREGIFSPSLGPRPSHPGQRSRSGHAIDNPPVTRFARPRRECACARVFRCASNLRACERSVRAGSSVWKLARCGSQCCVCACACACVVFGCVRSDDSAAAIRRTQGSSGRGRGNCNCRLGWTICVRACVR